MAGWLPAVAGTVISLILFWRLRLARQRMERLESERRLLRERDRQAQTIFENVAGAIMILGPDGRVQEASPGILRLLGLTASAVRGTICGSIIHPEDVAEYDALLRTLLASPGAEIGRQLRLLHASGSSRHVELVATNLLADSSVGGFLLHLQDVTELKRAQAALEEREARLRATLNQAPAILWVTDQSLRMIHVMGASLRTLGYTPDRLMGMNLSALLGPQGEPNTPLVEQALDGLAGEVEFELRGRRFRAHVEPFRGEDGQVVGLLGAALDITGMTRAQSALLEEGRLHRLLTELGSDLIAFLDSSGQVTHVSPAVQTLLGFTPTEFRALRVADLIHPDEFAAVRAAHEQVQHDQPVRIAYRIRRKDGTYVWLETISRVVRDGRGEVTGFVTTSRDVTEQKQLTERLERLAYHDHLTGLPNRTAFVEQLTNSLQTAQKGHVAVIDLDVDNFRVINDSLGHEAGDEALIEISDRLRKLSMVRSVARISGDEFIILLEEVADADAAISLAETITVALDAPLTCCQREFQVTCSLGITMGTPRVTPPIDLLREADVALQYAKRQGKSRYVLYHPSMSANSLERLELDADLRRAMRQQELMLYYQPIIGLKSHTVTGAEALLRWRHPRRGWIPPAEFIPIAEQTGYITTLGHWVLEQACREARTWQTKFDPEMPLSVSVNLSAIQVQDPALVDQVAEVLEKTGLSPECLTLEITETALMQNPEFTRPILQRLKSLGVRLAMDDFGAGHSSLHYLKEFPIDVLKIDRSFVSGLGLNRVDSALVRTVINLAGVLDMAVTAEGVESPEQVAELVGIGCDKAQGYYYALPVPSTELGPVLAGLSLRAVKGL